MSEPIARVGRRVDISGLPPGAALPGRQAPPDPAAHHNPVADHLADQGDMDLEPIVFPGELLTTSTTLAVRLDGDDRESYFGAKHTGIVQEGETVEHVIQRGITIVNDSCYANIADVMNTVAQQAAIDAQNAQNNQQQ